MDECETCENGYEKDDAGVCSLIPQEASAELEDWQIGLIVAGILICLGISIFMVIYLMKRKSAEKGEDDDDDLNSSGKKDSDEGVHQNDEKKSGLNEGSEGSQKNLNIS